MKIHLLLVLLAAFAFQTTSCTKKKESEAASEQNKFMEQLKARQELERRRQAAMQAERENFFKTPLKPLLSKAQVFRGPASAKVTIVEYTDFQCPYCSRGAATMKEVIKKYGNKVRVTVKHFPLNFHQHAMIAAQYYEAIARQSQNKALRFHDAIFEKQKELSAKGEAFLEAEAKKLKLNMAKLKKEIKLPAIKKKIENDMAEAAKFEIRGTPAFVVNGVPLKGAYPISEFSKVIDRHLGG